MEFFKILAQYLNSTDLSIAISEVENQIIVSVLPKPTSKDVNLKLKPLIFKGTPEELDEGFLSSLMQPLSEASGLIKNASQFEAQLAAEKKILSDKKDKKGKTDTSTKDSDKGSKEKTVSKKKNSDTDSKAETPPLVEKPSVQQTSIFPSA
jgi:PRTRC genetic system protein E